MCRCKKVLYGLDSGIGGKHISPEGKEFPCFPGSLALPLFGKLRQEAEPAFHKVEGFTGIAGPVGAPRRFAVEGLPCLKVPSERIDFVKVGLVYFAEVRVGEVLLHFFRCIQILCGFYIRHSGCVYFLYEGLQAGELCLFIGFQDSAAKGFFVRPATQDRGNERDGVREDISLSV